MTLADQINLFRIRVLSQRSNVNLNLAALVSFIWLYETRSIVILLGVVGLTVMGAEP